MKTTTHRRRKSTVTAESGKKEVVGTNGDSTQRIIPFLWFDDQAEVAVNYYVGLFRKSKIGNITRYTKATEEVSGKAEGAIMTVEFEIEGESFTALNGGPQFSFTPAVSLFVSCETEDEIDQLFEKLSDGGTALMPLEKYPFSERFGWVNDRYGVSWQLNLARGEQKITPFLMFVGDQHGKAGEAVKSYVSLFDDSGITRIERYGPDENEPEGTVKHAAFTLRGQTFMAMDSSREHDFTFTEAISFLVECRTQEEVDRFWEELTADGGEEGPCGWLKDKYGVSWQIVPTVLYSMLRDKDAGRSERVTKALLRMKKIDIGGLQQAAVQK